MSATSDFYQAQSDKCTADATASKLTQVRDRNLRAAIAWGEMALRAVQTESARTERVAETARGARAAVSITFPA